MIAPGTNEPVISAVYIPGKSKNIKHTWAVPTREFPERDVIELRANVKDPSRIPHIPAMENIHS
jgi:hypothetical protein